MSFSPHRYKGIGLSDSDA